ncbi:DUF4405 domain-containing protein [Zooshikella sp. RANM57]|uniref:DUF4405 domain-containing protein n=1 Tax=Zooshikella sp. RANM57 TaxID=3425863 RepID=UPI003D701700
MIIKYVDIISFITLVLMTATGIFLEYVLPERSRGMSVLGLTRHQWGDIHYYVALVFLLMMSLHLLLHIKFIKSVILRNSSKEIKYRIAVGVLGLVGLFFLVSVPFVVETKNNNKLREMRWYEQSLP